MYRLLRNAHLILGLACLPFVLVYAISAVQMAHSLRIPPRVEEEDVAAPAGLDPRPLAAELYRVRGYGGEMGKPQPNAAGFRFTLTRPGANIVVTYDRSSGRAHLRRETRSILGMLNRLHHQNGLHHEDGRLNAWGWVLALVSIALLALGGTGVYLWFRIHTERVTGAILISANLVISLVLLTLMRL